RTVIRGTEKARLAGSWQFDLQPRSVQHQTAPALGVEGTETGVVHILGIARNRMARIGTMDTNLMGSAGYRRCLDETIAAKGFQHTSTGERRLSFCSNPDHTLT